MKSVFQYLLIFMWMLQSPLMALVSDYWDLVPSETVLIKMPNGERAWKEISKTFNQNKGLMKLIPANQSYDDYSESVSIEYCDVSILQKEEAFNLDFLLEMYKEKSAQNPNYIISRTLIEKGKDYFMEEVTIREASHSDRLSHEILRYVLTDTMFHKIKYASSHIDSDKKNQWINILKNISVVTYCEAALQKCVSFADCLQGLVLLGSPFDKWNKIDVQYYENGSVVAQYYPPPDINGSCINEVLEVISRPILNVGSIKDFYEFQKDSLKGLSNGEIQFCEIENSVCEIAFCFRLSEPLHVHAVVRSLITNRACYSFIYKHEGEMDSDCVKVIVEKLKTIKVE